MAFNRLMLTTAGKTQYAKAQQGKTLHFSRVAIGDGSIGTGSLVNRTALISEKMSLAIDTIQVVNSTESAIITGLSNSALEEGFYFREIGIFATDPDTSAEVLFLYDNAGTDGEFIPAFSSGVIINERLKFLILLDNVTSVTFTASGNPIYLSVDDIKDGTVGASALWSSTYIDARLNSVEGHITAAINTAAADATAKANAAQTAAEAASIPLVKKGAANGVAELDYSGKVPTAQLPSYVDDVLDAYVVSGATAYTAGWLSLTNGGAALTPEISKIYIVLSDGDYQSKTYRWSGTTYAEISPSIALGETSSTAYRGDRGKTAYE
ncbi:MAG: phage tail protein, partial [Oscillospiraceae bacterium]